jgi:hypothetical protein
MRAARAVRAAQPATPGSGETRFPLAGSRVRRGRPVLRAARTRPSARDNTAHADWQPRRRAARDERACVQRLCPHVLSTAMTRLDHGRRLLAAKAARPAQSPTSTAVAVTGSRCCPWRRDRGPGRQTFAGVTYVTDQRDVVAGLRMFQLGSRRALLAFGVEDEGLHGHPVDLGVDAAVQGAHGAAGDVRDGLADSRTVA